VLQNFLGFQLSITANVSDIVESFGSDIKYFAGETGGYRGSPVFLDFLAAAHKW
jgi:hypothetical protein